LEILLKALANFFELTPIMSTRQLHIALTVCLRVGNPDFIKQLVNFDKDNISDRVLKKIGTYVVQGDFQPDIVGRVSSAAKSLCMWVRAMELYGRIYRVVEPKRQRLYAAESTLREKQAMLQEAMDKLAEVS